MFCTVLSYVTLRLLGEEMDGGDGSMERARKWVLDHGGATRIPSWGKMWLSVLGVYEWSGNNPLLPELWLLPYLFPAHPGSGLFMLCEDLFYPHPLLQDIVWACIHNAVEPLLTRWPFSKLRQRALDSVMQRVHYEDETTQYVCLGPVNKVLNMLCCWVEDPNSEAYKCHLARIKDYLWVAEDGMKMQGYNGSQFWDVSFAVQAILATNFADEFAPMLKKAHNFIKNTQVPLIQDSCEQNGLQAGILLSQLPSDMVGEAMPADRFYDAVNVILSLQSASHRYGSWGVCFTYGTWFGIKGLVAGGRTYQNSNSIQIACEFLLSKQLVSGGWGESYLSSQDMVTLFNILSSKFFHCASTLFLFYLLSS
ncbi:hypothetical protein POTOM_022869 [Populus tomentosa]|uniref:Cycloartenol synthase n=1 Tax=Populus tomentosa TaxID=118781 RepID=A0A8X8CQ60_POPTO|nr:hypothetical protein POTOM_022869 [Populus tomentosa]